jgi:hypothetical protein
MKNLKTIAATFALTTILATNTFAGIMISDLKTSEPTCSDKTSWGIIIVNLASSVANSFGIIIVNATESAPECKETVDNGIILVN